MDNRSQNKRIAAWLLAGKKINPMLALEKFGVFRLSGRIFDLKAEGMDIIPTRVRDKRSGKYWCEYRLAEKS